MKVGTLYASGPTPSLLGIPAEKGWRIYRIIDEWDEELVLTVKTKREAARIVKNQQLPSADCPQP